MHLWIKDPRPADASP